MEESIAKYKDYLSSKNLSNNTIDSYMYDINSFIVHVENEFNTDWKSIKKSHILTYLVSLQKSGKSSSTISRTICAIRKLFEFAKKEDIVSDNPTLNIHSPKQVKKTPSILTEEEINQLLSLPDTKTFKGSRDSAILELLYSSGIKVTELIEIEINQINLHTGIIIIHGNKQRLIPLSNYSKHAINNYLNDFRNIKSKDDNGYLFLNITGEPISRQGIWKILKYYEKKMNLTKELSPQILRNSFAVHMLSHGADLGTIQELMGLSSSSAQNYLNSIETKSFDVFKKTFPRA